MTISTATTTTVDEVFGGESREGREGGGGGVEVVLRLSSVGVGSGEGHVGLQRGQRGRGQQHCLAPAHPETSKQKLGAVVAVVSEKKDQKSHHLADQHPQPRFKNESKSAK